MHTLTLNPKCRHDTNSMRIQSLNNLNKQSAFSLIEVLIALLILAIGMLAFAASEIMGQRGTHSALKRSHATTLANDLAERMHANPTGNYTKALSKASCLINPTKTCSATTVKPQADSCSTDEMADFDLYEWFCGSNSKDNVNYRGGAVTLLGGPDKDQPVTATITCSDSDTTDPVPCSPGSSYSISISWLEREPDRDQTISNRAHGDSISKKVDVVVVP